MLRLVSPVGHGALDEGVIAATNPLLTVHLPGLLAVAHPLRGKVCEALDPHVRVEAVGADIDPRVARPRMFEDEDVEERARVRGAKLDLQVGHPVLRPLAIPRKLGLLRR